MDLDDVVLLVVIILLAPLGLVVWALIALARLRGRVETLTNQIVMLDHRLLRADERFAGLGLPPTIAPAPEAAPPPPAAAPEATPSTAAEPAPLPPPVAPEPLAVAAAPPREPAIPDLRRLEQRLAENWLVWLGGVTLALGGAFLVKLSIDYGLLTPAVRVALAIVLGIGLCLGADRVARRERGAGETGHGDESSYVPQALAAAGAAIVFSALYAAYGLYQLIPGELAFPLLAATAMATVAMSLRHGPLVGALGLVGAYVVPLLVASDAPHALPLFVYLALVTAAALAVVRHRAWWWLAWLALAGGVSWPLFWLGLPLPDPESPVVGLYLLVQLGLFVAFRRGVPRVRFFAGVATAAMVGPVVRVAFAALAVALLSLVHVAGYDKPSLGAAYVAAALMLAFAYRDRDLDDVIATAAALLLAVLATWKLPFLAEQQVFLATLRLPVELGDFATACAAAALLFGLGGFAAQGRAPRAGRWAALSVAAPGLVLIIAYWRLHDYGIDLGWSSMALVLAGLDLAAAAGVARRRNGDSETEIALAAYAVGVLGATILAATFALSTAWLTVAIALHLPVLGWVDGRLNVPVLRRLALVVAGIVLVRLALNPYLLSYPLGPTPIVNWLLYGYGLPALAFIVATRQFGSRADDLLVGVLEAGSLLFVTLLLTFELRHALYARLDAPLADLGRDALSPLLWLVLAGASLWLGERRARPVLRWGGAVLFSLASGQIVFWQVMVANPMITGAPVGDTLIFDALSLAYGLPALIAAAIAVLGLGPRPLRLGARLLAVGLALVWVTLEIRHAFQGSVLTAGPTGDAEWYVYSAAWLAFAAAALAIGLVWRNEWLRRAALAGVGLVVAKVFLSDMADIEGVWRALSFLCLGGALIGIGYAYRRLRPLQEA